MLPVLTLQVAGAAATQAGDSVTYGPPPPLPGGPATVARFLLNAVPQWVQIGGVILGALVAIVVVTWGVTHWRSVLAWLGKKSRPWKMSVAGVVVVVAGVVSFAGFKTWHFMMHDNAFCSGCHVMNTPFQKFGSSDSKHARLLCHDCHQQSIFASMKELYVWVLDRPEKIPAHANNVPNRVCETCHEQPNPDSTWKHIAATAGHQVHLNPRSPVFKQIECIVCHATEVHRFKTADRTCGQAGCHDKLPVQLGRMANQSDLHCATCHKFTVAALATNPVDSAKVALTPTEKECFSCHQMKQRIGTFDPDSEPHGAVCGTCHNPHTQTTTFGAFQSCATAQCHAQADTLTAMHRGLGDHKLDNCGACHVAHSWKARATDCRSCHRDIDLDKTRTRRGRIRLSLALPDEPVRATPALWLGANPTPARVRPAIRHGTRSPTVRQARSPASFPQVAADTATFSHRRHRQLACTDCHDSKGGHGTLTIVRSSQCRACHHANDARGATCETCHRAPPVPVRTTVAMRFADKAPVDRQLPFAHERHTPLKCPACHSTDIDRTVVKGCTDCHASHHTLRRDCSTCHRDARASHTTAVHLTGCGGSGCHASTSAAVLKPARPVCLTCHTAQAAHKPGRECSSCHLTSWPSSP